MCYKYYNYFELIVGCNTSDSSFTDSEDDEELKCDKTFVDSDEFDNFNDSESEDLKMKLRIRMMKNTTLRMKRFDLNQLLIVIWIMVKARKQKEGIYMCVYILYTCIYNYTVCFSFTVSYKYNDCTVNSEL